MAQDNGHWSVRRPRETLGGLTLNSTAIPQPPSALKRSNSSVGAANYGAPVPFSTSGHMRSLSGSRHSLAPTRPSQPLFQRASTSGNNNQTTLADMGLASVKRSSVRPPFTPGMAGRASTDGSGDRRSSVYRGGRQSTVGGGMGGMGGMSSLGGGVASMGGGGSHQSFFSQAPAPAGALRDPRPLKERAYLARIGQEVIEYMTQHNFELEMNHTLSQNVIKSPTQKDFVCMFQWLYRRIDPSYRFQKSIDQEVPLLMKQIRYPYEKGITRSQIAAVGGQNWGTFLGMLHWMMELAVMLERYSSNRYDDVCAEAGIDVVADHITFEFLAHAYQDWLVMDVDADGDEGGDDAEQLAKMLAPHIDNMTRQLDQAYAKHEEELAILEAEHAKLLQDISDLEKSTPDLAALDEDFKVMEEDKVKFEEYNELALQRCERHETRIPLFQEELDRLNEEVTEAENEQRSLQQAVDDQGISMADIDRMNSERERLQKGIEAASQRLEDAKRKVAEREVDASRRLDELERTVDRYNTLAYQIALIPSTAANAKGRDFELRVRVNEGPGFGESTDAAAATATAAAAALSGTGNMETDRLLADPVTGYQPAHILNLDLRGHVKNSFLALRKEVAERRSTALETMMKDHDLLDSIKEAMEDKRSEVEALEHRVRAAEQEHEKTKEVTTAQRLASDAQIEKMEKELAKMRASLSESVQLMEQREMNTNIEYEQLTLRASALREELHTEIMRMLNDVIKFKMHVQKNLEEYEEFVTEELVKELGDGEEAK
ncbi:kinetochore-associated Ndc80 complex subunit ndc80 [Sporothrix curviconia]|uniref:Kinetochore protein NDC80 n=1 Tax=Sporothrix curviconia TaxID=1260050 RepID=A0ABP0C0P0_9PEZI